MSLKTLVKVSEVNNLSDARYCAGMGVDMIGFMLDENHPKYIELAKIREISVWLSGISSVGEFTGTNIENINYLGKELNLDYVQINHPIEKDYISGINFPVIQRIDCDGFSENEIENFLKSNKHYVRYFLLDSNKKDTLLNLKNTLKKWCLEYPIILGGAMVTEDSLSEILDSIHANGIELKGGQELRPGLKSFDELAAILEKLEEDN